MALGTRYTNLHAIRRHMVFYFDHQKVSQNPTRRAETVDCFVNYSDRYLRLAAQNPDLPFSSDAVFTSNLLQLWSGGPEEISRLARLAAD